MKNVFSLLGVLLLGASSIFAQTAHVAQTATGNLSANTTSDPVVGLRFSSKAIMRLDITTLTLADADDEVDFYIQTSYDGGSTWVDVQNLHFSTADTGSTAVRLVEIGGAQDGPGTLLSITGTDPAANAEISEAVPANTVWSVRSISASLVTDANAADRRVRATLDDGTTVYYQVSVGANHTASLTVRHTWTPFGASAVGIPAVTDATFITPLPSPTILSAGNRFITITGAIQAGDNWGAPQLLVEAWHDPNVSTDGTMGDNLISYRRPLGDRVRVKVLITGASAPTFAYSATLTTLINR